jgi:hypothetical protein
MNGRPKGSRNKIPGAVLEAFNQVFISLGGTKAFTEWAKIHKSDFYKLFSKLLPSKIEFDSKAEELPIIINFVPAKPRDFPSYTHPELARIEEKQESKEI